MVARRITFKVTGLAQIYAQVRLTEMLYVDDNTLLHRNEAICTNRKLKVNCGLALFPLWVKEFNSQIVCALRLHLMGKYISILKNS